MKARIKFKKEGNLRFIGHLDVMRHFQKVMRRARIPIAFTAGYNPHMIMSFASPLGIGLTSQGEYFDIELAGHISSAEAVRRMNAVTAEGMEVISFRQIAEEKKMTAMAIASAADYLVGCKCRENGAVFTQERITGFLGQQEIVVTKQTKRSEQEADIRPLIYQMELTKEGIYLQLAAGSAQNLKPELVMSALCRFAGIDEASMTWTRRRLEMYADLTSEEERAEGIRKLVTLEALGKDIE
ncbi:MAG: TIGR03936 family radical SAM-associated protein [Schaedlerella sp.]|uniref:TIGR03936 family radical SAM-associated protein n=1 Tax=Schaedlerella sp. TaxID=2676057 RepID=UPI00265F9D8D|nr:TIGR03936 family radical SAM-associated protein [uncultured Schaedlerella sp.]